MPTAHSGARIDNHCTRSLLPIHSFTVVCHADNSGTIDYEEFRGAVRKGGKLTPNQMSEVELRGLFAIIDGDQSGSITIDELTAFVWGPAAVSVLPPATANPAF